MTTKPEELIGPQFPALSMCLIIDARHSSRSEIVRDVKASNLFETIVEAKSLDDGKRIISNHNSDACFIGPSVSRASASNLVKRLSESTMSKDCAFIVILNNEDKDDLELISAGCHQLIRLPCSKMKFSEGVVRGVITANMNSPWTGILLNAEKSGIDLFEEPGSPTKKRSTDQEKLSISGLNAIFPEVASEMQNVLTNIESGNYGLDEGGKPNAATSSAITSLVSGMLGNRDLGTKNDSVRQFLESALLQWFLDLKTLSQQQATQSLKKKLTAFFHNC